MHRDRTRLVAVALSALLLLPACDSTPEGVVEDPGITQWTDDLPDPVEKDWEAIVADDTLTALLTFNSTTYFLYRGEAMGYEFRALRAFAEEHDLALRPRVVRDRTELFRLLNEGEGDVVAARLIPVPAFQEVVELTDSLYQTRPTLVQRDGSLDETPIPERAEERIQEGGRELEVGEPVEIRARVVQRPRELQGDTIHLPRGSEYYQRVVEISDTADEVIELVELEDALSYESLVRRVAAGDVRFTVTSRNVAELSDEYYTNLVVQPVMGPRHPVSWAVRSNAPVLLDSLDAWIERERDGTLSELYRTYFVEREAYREREASEYLTSSTGRLSPYDSLLAVHAATIGWDWRLLASQAFQESKFDPDARSWAGAMGVLQLMPATAREVDVSDPFDPAENIAGGARYLQWLQEQWQGDIADPEARLPFILASYNAGRGHVLDARRLAEKNGDDPDDWDEVSYWMLQLAKRRYYTDPVVEFGYARGLEPVTYVSLIRERYEHYLEFVAEQPGGPLPSEAEAVTGDGG